MGIEAGRGEYTYISIKAAEHLYDEVVDHNQNDQLDVDDVLVNDGREFVVKRRHFKNEHRLSKFLTRADHMTTVRYFSDLNIDGTNKNGRLVYFPLPMPKQAFNHKLTRIDTEPYFMHPYEVLFPIYGTIHTVTGEKTEFQSLPNELRQELKPVVTKPDQFQTDEPVASPELLQSALYFSEAIEDYEYWLRLASLDFYDDLNKSGRDRFHFYAYGAVEETVKAYEEAKAAQVEYRVQSFIESD